jgi:hypothetical protein
MAILKRYKVPLIILLVVCLLFGSFLYYANQNKTKAPTVTKPKVYKGTEPNTGISLDKIQDGFYYVYHKGKAYPIQSAFQTNGLEAATDKTDATRVLMTDAAGVKNIPTLYLGSGDKLIYRNSKTAINTIRYERYQDEGYSFGIYGANAQPNGTYTIALSGSSSATSSTKSNIRSSSSAQAIASTLTDTKATYTFASIGKGKHAVAITKKVLSPGGFVKPSVLVENPKAGSIVPEERVYPVNIYAGTESHTFDIKSDTRYFTGMELYAEYTKGLDTTSTYQTLEIPDYLPDGYYAPNFGGVFRLVRGTEYKDTTDFNKRQLAVNQTTDYSTNTEVDSVTGQTNCYSTSPDLNTYTTKDPNAFGFNRADQTTDSDDESSTIEAENTDKTYSILPKEGKSYTFTVTTTGDKGTVAYETPVDGWTFTPKANSDGTTTYTSTISGNGQENKIKVSGFSGKVTVDLDGAESKTDESKTDEKTDKSSGDDTAPGSSANAETGDASVDLSEGENQ